MDVCEIDWKNSWSLRVQALRPDCLGLNAKLTNYQLCDLELSFPCDSIHPSVNWDKLQYILHESGVRIQLLNPLV